MASVLTAPAVPTPESTYKEVQGAYNHRANNAINDALKNRIAAALGYDAEDVANIPLEANLGEGCGNPLTIAGLKEGHVVVDLGSGGGLDCFLASKQVGPRGKVVGIDMSEDMVALARRNALNMNATNVEFIHSKINELPLEDNSVDCVMSNCVLNLVPDEHKLDVIREIHRILKPCGRLAISDFLALKPFTQEMKADTSLRSGCVSGSIEVDEMQKFLYDIGFDDVLLVNTERDLSLYKDGENAKSVTPCCAGGSCAPNSTASGRQTVDYDLNEWIASFQMYGHKWCGKTTQNLPRITSASSAQNESKCAKTNCC